MPIDPIFRKHVKDALEHLYDTAYLETHPLLTQIILDDSINRTSRAQKMRGLLKDLIESLRPQQGLPANSPEWRSYRALRCRYVQGMPSGQVEAELGISIRQLQREFHKGIDAIATLLWEQRTGGDPLPPAPAPPAESEDFDEMQSELEQWAFHRSACSVFMLLEDALWLVKPLVDKQNATLDLEVAPALPMVLVDATLTRQALLKLIRMQLAGAPQSIRVRAIPAGAGVKVILSDTLGRDLSQDPDWRIVEMLCDQQGAALAVEQPGFEIVLTLPGIEQRLVLVVDDNPALHQLFERYLATTRYAVAHAFTGEEALEQAAARQPDFITLDVMMAGLDGWQVLRELQADARTATIPVIVCSVLREPDLALAMGAKAYLKKPVDRLELQAALDRLQTLKEN